jgi:hypothetical protein
MGRTADDVSYSFMAVDLSNISWVEICQSVVNLRIICYADIDCISSIAGVRVFDRLCFNLLKPSGNFTYDLV